MANRTIDTDLNVSGVLDAVEVTQNGVAVVVSTNVPEIVNLTQAAFDALGPGRPSKLYVITG